MEIQQQKPENNYQKQEITQNNNPINQVIQLDQKILNQQAIQNVPFQIIPKSDSHFVASDSYQEKLSKKQSNVDSSLIKQSNKSFEFVQKQQDNFPPNISYPFNPPQLFVNQMNQQQNRYQRFLQFQRVRYEMEMRLRAGPSFNSYQNFQNANKSESMYSEESQIVQNNRKKSNRKYLRSTNNSHKKYLTILKRLFFSVMSPDQIAQFQEAYSKYKCSRTYFFIILVYMKYKFSQKLRQSIRQSFIEDMRDKIKAYEQQILSKKDERFRNYRRQEVYEISFSIKAINQFYEGAVQKAIQTIYKKDKEIIIKKTLFDHSVKFILNLQNQLKQNPGQMIQKPYSEQLGEQLRANNTGFVFPLSKDAVNISTKKQQFEQGQLFNLKDDIDKILMINQIEELKNNESEQEQVEIYPPIPPSFYLPEFSKKYAALFRRAKSIRIWASIGKKIQKKNRQLQAQSH